ncbi:MAG: response regulator transcription factor [Phycisphaerae bacterium]|nr:response regulator transcription factor [Phycisphaerae bacterium]
MRLVLVDDHAIMRQGLRVHFERRGKVEIVGEAEDGETAVELVHTLRPDAVIMDITLPELSGIEAMRSIHAFDPAVKLVVLSMHTEHCIVTEAIKAGADAYVLKSADFEEIEAALEAAVENKRYLSPEITGLVIQDFLGTGPCSSCSGFMALTERERQVLQLTAQGLSVKVIARDINLSPKTVDAARRNIMQKMGIHSIAGLTKLAIREGLISMEL